MSSSSADKYRSLGLIFDTVSAVVSLLDLCTDVIILVSWHQQNRMVFFWISVCILILAQLSYITIFYYNHGTRNDPCHSMLSLMCTIPFAPILSFVFYLVSDSNSFLRSFIDDYLLCFNFEWTDNFYQDSNQTAQRQFLEHKLAKHLGFLMEALIEAFPQSILQLTAIVYYNEPSVISIVSILISMSSVCSKMFLLSLSIAETTRWKIRIFLWLCFVVDFIGVFFMVSFSFYTPSNAAYAAYFTVIQRMVWWECIIGIIPCIVIASIGCHLYWTTKWTRKTGTPLLCCCICCGVTGLWIMGLFASLLIMTVFTTFWVGFTLLFLSTFQRVWYSAEAKAFYEDTFTWILDDAKNVIEIESGAVLVTTRQDRIIRVCVANKVILLQQQNKHNASISWNEPWNNHCDKYFWRSLCEWEKDGFKNVTWSQIREVCNASASTVKHTDSDLFGPKYATFWRSFFYFYYAIVWLDFRHDLERSRGDDKCENILGLVFSFVTLFVTGPVYIVSRWMNVLLPIIIALYLWLGGGINVFVDIDTFQSIMWLSYVALLLIWSTLLYFVAREEFFMWHVLPTTQHLRAGTKAANTKVSAAIQSRYRELIEYPLIERALMYHFGTGIAQMILDYYNAIESEVSTA